MRRRLARERVTADDVHQGASRGEEVLHLFKRGAEFTKELLEDNERLRMELVRFHEEQQYAARTPEDWDKLRQELTGRLKNLEAEYETVRERLAYVESENRAFANRYLDIEEENNNLANLYVASHQLHSTLDLAEVVKIILEIVINLIGAEVFALYMLEREDSLQPVAAEGVARKELPPCTVGQGKIGKAVLAPETTCWDPEASDDLSEPIVVIPLQIQKRPIGAIAIFNLLQQKEGFSALDHELFNVLGGHAATAILAARLYSRSERKLNTIQGFLDLMAK